MLAVNCRAYQAALILFDTIKRVANRECTSCTTGSAPAHTTVPFYDHVETSTMFSAAPVYTETSNQNTEEKLKNVMSAWFSKDPPAAAASPAQPAASAPVITSVHQHSGTQIPSTYSKRTGDSDWLHVYPQQSSMAFPVSQTQFDSPKSEYSKCAALVSLRRATELTGIWRVIMDEKLN